MSILQEFKTFINRGNVVDLAVGVVIGASFQKIVSSLVKDIVMPPIGLIVGGVDFSELKFRISGIGTSPVTINYGAFFQSLFDFLIIATAVFFLVKMVNRLKDELGGLSTHSTPPPPPADIALLTEIRDLLKKKTSP